jgi:carbamate kinase
MDEQATNARLTAQRIAQFVAEGWKIVLTHGNGPQVGAALLRSERAAGEVYAQPLDVCVASTQSEIGYFLQLGLEYELRRVGITMPVVTVLTKVEVSEDDPAFLNPTKPIGPFYSKSVADQKQHDFGWTMIEDAARGYRRVVPSPQPKRILEQEVIRQMLNMGILVIALGGGGIPVVAQKDHLFRGVEAVIDKDRASAMLASALNVDLFLISTDVDRVYLNYKSPNQRALCRATATEMRHYCREGHFPNGSMGPKIESALRFLAGGGREVIITSCEKLAAAVNGNAGTHIYAET